MTEKSPSVDGDAEDVVRRWVAAEAFEAVVERVVEAPDGGGRRRRGHAGQGGIDRAGWRGRGVERELHRTPAVAHRGFEGGAVGIATEGRAPVLERARRAQTAGPGLEVTRLAGPADGPPHGLRPLGEEPGRPFGWPGLDDGGVAEVHEADDGGATAERLLAQEGVEVHPTEAVLLVVDAGGPAGLVVGDDELAVLVLLQAVDDAQHQQAAHLRLQAELQAHGGDGLRVLQGEVRVHEGVGVGDEDRQLIRRQLEHGELPLGRVLVLSELHRRLLDAGVGRGGGALVRREAEEDLQGAVDERALDRVGAGRLRQLLDAGEAERQGAVRERLDPGRREAGRHRVGHGGDGTPGVLQRWGTGATGPLPGGHARARSLTTRCGAIRRTPGSRRPRRPGPPWGRSARAATG